MIRPMAPSRSFLYLVMKDSIQRFRGSGWTGIYPTIFSTGARPGVSSSK